jgi:hypothetical protein
MLQQAEFVANEQQIITVAKPILAVCKVIETNRFIGRFDAKRILYR